MALVVPGVADVIGVLGGSLGTLLMIVCPSIIYMKTFPQNKDRIMLTVMGAASGAAIVAVGFAVRQCL
jgi:hypothetical protein